MKIWGNAYTEVSAAHLEPITRRSQSHKEGILGKIKLGEIVLVTGTKTNHK